jgi:hypothetical protein
MDHAVLEDAGGAQPRGVVIRVTRS